MTNFDFDKAVDAFKTKFGRTWTKHVTAKVYRNNYLNRKNDALVIEVIKGFIRSSQKLPTPSQFERALRRRERQSNKPQHSQACDICGNSGLVYLTLYTDLERYQYQLPGEEPPEWYKTLPARSKQPVSTKIVRCKCGRNRNTEFISYAEVVGRQS
jgi:DNA-directed RNA polymerase subunit M/transcription elongation factor TFIIS